jgi:magnesium-transporting ATPase (P-type)
MSEESPRLPEISAFLNKYRDKNWAVVIGSQMELLTMRDWAELHKKEAIVFARVTPQDKLTIVKRS